MVIPVRYARNDSAFRRAVFYKQTNRLLYLQSLEKVEGETVEVEEEKEEGEKEEEEEEVVGEEEDIYDEDDLEEVCCFWFCKRIFNYFFISWHGLQSFYLTVLQKLKLWLHGDLFCTSVWQEFRVQESETIGPVVL